MNETYITPLFASQLVIIVHISFIYGLSAEGDNFARCTLNLHDVTVSLWWPVTFDVGVGNKKCLQEGWYIGGGADTLTNWLRTPNTCCCLQPRLARGLGQHNLCVLDNFSAWQVQLGAAPQQHNIRRHIPQTHISKFENLAYVRVIDRDRLWGPQYPWQPQPGALVHMRFRYLDIQWKASI